MRDKVNKTPRRRQQMCKPCGLNGSSCRGKNLPKSEDTCLLPLPKDQNIIETVAGTSQPGDGPDEPTLATEVALNQPNGLWVRGDGVIYVPDTGHAKVRRLGTNGLMSTVFKVPGGISGGRGLWVSDDESEVYLSSYDVLKRWTADDDAGYVRMTNFSSELHCGLM
jgi:hypothetical protein